MPLRPLVCAVILSFCGLAFGCGGSGNAGGGPEDYVPPPTCQGAVVDGGTGVTVSGQSNFNLEVHGDDGWAVDPSLPLCIGSELNPRVLAVTREGANGRLEITRTEGEISFAFKGEALRSPGVVDLNLRFRVCVASSTARFTSTCTGSLNHALEGSADVSLTTPAIGGTDLCRGFSSKIGEHALAPATKTVTISGDAGSPLCQDFQLWGSAYVAPHNPGQLFDLSRRGSARYDANISLRVE